MHAQDYLARQEGIEAVDSILKTLEKVQKHEEDEIEQTQAVGADLEL